MIGYVRFALSVRMNLNPLKNDRRSEHRMKDLQKPRRLFQGDTPISLSAGDFEDAILFIEDLPEFFSPNSIRAFLEWLRTIGALHRLKGMIIGKLCESSDFREHKKIIEGILSYDPALFDMPVLYGLNFGHTSPMFILPYGAMAEIDCERKSFSILENGVL